MRNRKTKTGTGQSTSFARLGLPCHTPDESVYIDEIQKRYARPVVLLRTKSGQPVDGIRSCEAARKFGGEVIERTLETDEPDFIVRYRLNCSGRRLTKGQRAMIVVNDNRVTAYLSTLRGDYNDNAADLAGCANGYIHYAKTIRESGRYDLVAAVILGKQNGGKSLGQAYETVKAQLNGAAQSDSNLPKRQPSKSDRTNGARVVLDKISDSVRDALESLKTEIRHNPRFQDRSYLDDDDVHHQRGGLWNDTHGRIRHGATEKDLEGLRRSLREVGIEIAFDSVEQMWEEYVHYDVATITIQPLQQVELQVRRYSENVLDNDEEERVA